MTVAEVMANITPNPSAATDAMVDDMVFAINPTPGNPTADPDTYLVAQGNVLEQTGNVTTNTTTNTYVREGESIDVASVGRSFTINGHRRYGNAFQDFVVDVDRMYATGDEKRTDYIWFSMVTGEGERGQVSIAPSQDSGGTAGEKSAFSFVFNKVGAAPAPYTYAPGTPTP